MALPFLPYQKDPIAGGLTTPNSWYIFFSRLREYLVASGIEPGVIDAILARLDELEENELGNFIIQGLLSVQVLGLPENGVVQVQLVNDEDAPGVTYQYVIDPDGRKGWHLKTPDEFPSSIGVYMIDEDGDYMIDENNVFEQSDALLQVEALPDSIYANIQDFINTMNSPGIIDGGVITDIGSGNVRITAGHAMLRVADDDVSTLTFARFSETDFAVPNDQLTKFFGVVYNGGSPIVEMRSTFDWDKDTEIPLGSAARINSTITNVTPNRYRVGDPITNVIQRYDAIAPAQRDESIGGLALGNTGTRNSTLTAGVIWSRLEDFTSPAKNSSTDPMISFVFNGVNITVTGGVTQWDNTHYNDLGTGTLVVMANNKFANLWFFVSIDGTKWGYAYGTAEYNTAGAAQGEGPPSYLNQNFRNNTVLLGRYIFQKGTATPTLIESAFVSLFTQSVINDHNLLANLQGGALGEYYHLTAAEYNDLITPAVGVVHRTGAESVAGVKTFTDNIGTANTQIRATDATLTALTTSAGAQPRFQLAAMGPDAATANNRNGIGMGRFFNDNGSPALYAVKSRGASVNDNSVAVNASDFVGQFFFEASNATGVGTSLTRGAAYHVVVETAPVGAIVPMRHVWRTMNSAGTLADRWFITASGSLSPATTNANNIGAPSLRPATVHAVNVDVSGAVLESGVVSPAQLTANTDNWAVTGITAAGIIRASTDASRNLTGIATPTAGQVILLFNVGAFDLVLVHDATSTAANRFLCPGSVNLTLNPNDSVRLWYDNTSSRWRVTGV